MTEPQFGMPDDNANDLRAMADPRNEPGQPIPAHREDGQNSGDTVQAAQTPAAPRRVNWSRAVVYGVLPGVALVLAMAAGLLKWKDSSQRNADIARAESVQAAKDATVALLSYRPDTVEKDVAAAQTRLTGGFFEVYSQVARDVLIPDAKERQITTVASVPAAASVSATQNTAVVLVFIDQTVTTGASPPDGAATSARVTLDKVGGRWLVSKFETV
jgi:Mce-associated membrane protein